MKTREIANPTPAFARHFVDLAQPRLNAEVISASDDFFGAMERLISPAAPVFIPDRYDEHGKWMDGWETRRRRAGGHDWLMLRICPGVVRGFEIDTSYFTGNFPPEVSIDACVRDGGDPRDGDETTWVTLLDRCSIEGDCRQFFQIHDDTMWTHLKLNIFPDGGIARLRVYGEVHCDWDSRETGEILDLAAMVNGGRALDCSDMHYGHMSNLVAPGQAINMGDGWETRRRRGPGFDWVLIQLGHPGTIQRIEVDTSWFKGNYPAECALRGALLPEGEGVTPDSEVWRTILPRAPLGPNQLQVFEDLREIGPVSHVRFDIHPDGGVSRLRLLGRCARPGKKEA